MKNPANKRRFIRTSIDTPVSGHITRISGGRVTECPIAIIGLNMGGAFIATSEKLKVGASYRLKFNIPNDALEDQRQGVFTTYDIDLEGRIMNFHEETVAKGGSSYCYGVEFVYLQKDSNLVNLSTCLNYFNQIEDEDGQEVG